MPLAESLLPARRSETFVWRFENPPEKIWPSLADTNRFNEAAGLPRYAVEETPRPDGGVDFLARGAMGWLKLVWREQPATWATDRWFRHDRHFENGPLTFLSATLRLYPEGDGARGEYTIEAAARNLFGRIALATRFFSSAKESFDALARQADVYASGRREIPFDVPGPRLQPGAQNRLAAAAAAIDASPFGHALGRRLTQALVEWPEVDVRAIRPLALARRWGVQDRLAVEACLQAVRAEALGMRWDLLCPRCQGAKATAPSLDLLPTEAHCASCNLSYGRDYARNVELAFFPAQSIRLTDDREFCLFGPMSTPHIRAQIRVPAGESVDVDLGLEPGGYRLRTLEAGGETVVDWREGPFPLARAELEPAGRANGPSAPRVAMRADEGAAPDLPRGHVRFRNDTPFERHFILEELGWRRDALTAERVMTLQAFSDLFHKDILRPGDHLEIDHVSFLFADIKGSTALYERVGDARAYSVARSFFEVLGAAIRQEDGVLVKTIGDAVHAAFTSPADALACAIRIQRDVAAFNEGSDRPPLAVKIGLHAGRTICVTLNERLDYYGTAVNKCARLSDQSQGGDIVMSESFAADPSNAARLKGFTLQRESAAMKGLGASVPFLRLSAEQILAPAPAADRPEKTEREPAPRAPLASAS